MMLRICVIVLSVCLSFAFNATEEEASGLDLSESGSGTGEPDEKEECKAELFDNREMLGKFGENIWWDYDDESITFTLIIETLAYSPAWMGIGFSPDGTMAGADIIMLWMSNGKIQVRDMMADENTLPIVDESQDVEVLYACQNDDVFIATFRRKLDTCDDRDRVIDASTTHLIYAYSNNSIVGDDPVRENYHWRNRGMINVNLLNSVRNNWNPIDIRKGIFDVTASYRYDVEGDTQCVFVELPTFETPVYAMHFSVFGSALWFVENMIMYQCAGRLWRGSVNQPFACSDPNSLPHDAKFCKTVMMDWFGGNWEQGYPKGYGYKLGGTGQSSYAMLKIKSSTKADETLIPNTDIGFNVGYTTDKLESLGVLKINVLPHMSSVLPPKSPSFKSQAHCMDKCIDKVFNSTAEERIHINAVSFYAQNFAKSVILRHFRNNTELRPIAYDNEFGFIEKQGLNNPVAIEPGDYLVLECEYDTSNVNSTQYGGHGDTTRLCEAYVTYYPKMDFAICSSVPTENALFMKYKKSTLAEIDATLVEETWSHENLIELNQVLLDAEIYVQCSGQSESYLEGNSVEEHPKFNYTYVEPRKCSAVSAYGKIVNVFLAVIAINLLT